MIGTKYTPELLADLAKTPHLRSMEVPTTPDGQAIASYTKRYTEERECKTTIFDAGSSRFGCTLGYEAGKITVFSRLDGLSLSLVVRRWLDEESEVGGVSVIEETHTAVDTFTSFFEDDTAFDPWLRIYEPV